MKSVRVVFVNPRKSQEKRQRSAPVQYSSENTACLRVLLKFVRFSESILLRTLPLYLFKR
jgi:hypothetical protein